MFSGTGRGFSAIVAVVVGYEGGGLGGTREKSEVVMMFFESGARLIDSPEFMVRCAQRGRC